MEPFGGGGLRSMGYDEDGMVKYGRGNDGKGKDMIGKDGMEKDGIMMIVWRRR